MGTRSTLREQVIGTLIALYLLTGRWSPARIFDVEPSIVYEPRVWAVVGLLLFALLPAPRLGRPVPAARGATATVSWQLVYLSFALMSVAWAPDLEQAPENATNAALMLVATASLFRLCTTVDPRALDASIWRALTLLLAAMAAIAIAGGLGSTRLAILGGGPNAFGRSMGLLCAIALFRAIHGGRYGWWWAVGSTVAAALVVLSGSRGGMVATAAALASLLMMGRQGLSRRLFALGAFVCLGLVVVGYTELGASVVERFNARVLRLLFEEGYVSNRDRIFVTALDLGQRSPWVGHGLGSFAAMTPWPYAHNMFLDAFAETGLVGLLLFTGAIVQGGLMLLRYRARQLAPAAAAFVLYFMSAQFSGGLYDSRGVYVFLLLATVLEPRAFPPRSAARRAP